MNLEEWQWMMRTTYWWNHRIQKFTSGGVFIGTSGKNIPTACKRVYVADNSNHCIKVLYPDLAVLYSLSWP
jgi:hypothetical protein